MSERAHTMDATAAGWGNPQLQAYFDGELTGFARWRFERRLRRSPKLQLELEGLSEIGDLVREGYGSAEEPGVWDAVALRLPAEDARRAEAAPARRGGLGWLGLPAGAVAVVAALVVALTWGASTPAPSTGGAVRWLDSGGRSVMVLEDVPDTTIIWVLENAVEGAATGRRRT